MHLKTKNIALMAVMSAFSIILLVLGTVIESNTLFFTAGASFLVGVVISFAGPISGTAFYAVCLILSLIFLPNKMYCITYGAFGMYIIIREIARAHCKNFFVNWTIRFLIFNLFFVPIVCLFPKLFIFQELTGIQVFIIILVGQFAFVILDCVYEWFMRHFGIMIVKKWTEIFD